MGDTKKAAGREGDTWMNSVRERIPDIESVAKKADEPFRPIIFGRLLDVVIQDARNESGPQRKIGVPSAAPSSPARAANPSFERWLTEFGVSLDSLANVVDLESGVVLARNLGSSKADKERHLAALLALVNAYKTGAFYVGREELARACEEHAAYDTANFARHMKGVEFSGATVFTPDGDGYKVSRPGEAFVAEVVKSSLGGMSQ